MERVRGGIERHKEKKEQLKKKKKEKKERKRKWRERLLKCWTHQQNASVFISSSRGNRQSFIMREAVSSTYFRLLCILAAHLCINTGHFSLYG